MQQSQQKQQWCSGSNSKVGSSGGSTGGSTSKGGGKAGSASKGGSARKGVSPCKGNNASAAELAKYGCGKQSAVVYSFNHDIMASFSLEGHPELLKTNQASAV
jgi:hypothetical protein